MIVQVISSTPSSLLIIPRRQIIAPNSIYFHPQFSSSLKSTNYLRQKNITCSAANNNPTITNQVFSFSINIISSVYYKHNLFKWLQRSEDVVKEKSVSVVLLAGGKGKRMGVRLIFFYLFFNIWFSIFLLLKFVSTNVPMQIHRVKLWPLSVNYQLFIFSLFIMVSLHTQFLAARIIII